MNISDREECLDGIETFDELMREFIEATLMGYRAGQ